MIVLFFIYNIKQKWYNKHMSDIFERFRLMSGDEKLKNVQDKKVILFGVGGVGGYVAEMLVRSGISHLTIVDFDKVDITNINRQIVALHSTVGEYKVDVMKNRLLDINPDAKIVEHICKLDSETIANFDLQVYDFVVDCIDDVKAKQFLIKYCSAQKINIIVSCGAGNRYKSIPNFEVVDIKKTSYDRLAKLIRKFCQTEKINKLVVAYTKEQPIKCNNNVIGSVAYYPASMACAITSYVINQLLEK